MPAVSSGRYLVQSSWDDVPHLSEEVKTQLLESYPPHMRDARTKGIPSLGSGAIYPVPVEEIICDPFVIPAWWKRGFGLDVGWNKTAAIWGARNPDDNVLYLYAEHYRGQAEPPIHVTAIKARGAWIKGAIDPAARGRQQADGEQLLQSYRDLGLNLVPAVNAVEDGLYQVWTGLGAGQIKVFRTLTNFLAEYRIYRRDEKGKIVKQFDHLMDASRYLVATWDQIASVQAPERAVRGTASMKTADGRGGY